MTTVKRLKEMLADVPDDALIVVSGNDHDYRIADIHLTTAINYEPKKKYNPYICEDYGDEYIDKEASPDATRINVLLVT